ncbi:ABC transporter permease [Micromonospora endolithica]|uniref:ABC transporter permease n=2 Tax=Micromonospora endolithica TaxID=230091 RepID=A0A3A9ZMY0_9ACTN|nr:ABC transporter permease [Micromonospora endolithica]
MIVLPVLGLSFTAVTWDMARLTTAERMARQLGVADAELQMVSPGPVTQSPWGDGWDVSSDTKGPPPPIDPAAVAPLLPAGSRMLPVQRWASFEVLRGDRIDNIVQARRVDLADPLGRGLVEFLRGRAPAAPDEIAASEPALDRLGVRPGDRVTAADGFRTWTVVAVVEFPDQLGPVVVLPPEKPAGRPDHGDGTTLLVDLPGGIDADLVRRLNDHGLVITARAPVPGVPGDRTMAFGPPSAGMDLEGMSVAVLVGGLGLLEVVLLVGPAFAVGVRRRRRDLALVAVAGGDAVHLRRIVLADGLVLGASGAVVGVLLGVGAAVALRPLTERYLFQARFADYRFLPEALVLIAAVAVLAGVLAALVPAWTAARQDVVAGLAGRRTPAAYRRHWPVLGAALVAVGVGLAAVGANRTSPTVLLAGVVLGELGLVCVTPALVGLLARLGRALPVAPRIALRDASRNRSSAAPAISAVMAAVATSVALGVYIASDEARGMSTYLPNLPPGSVLVTQPDPNIPGVPDRDRVIEAARTHLGTEALVPLFHPTCAADDDPCLVQAVLPPGRSCPWQVGDIEGLDEADQRRARADERCQRDPRNTYDGYVETIVDDGTALPLLTGADPSTTAAATAALAAGGAVVTDPRYVHDGRLSLAVRRAAGPEQRVSTSATVAGYAVEVELGPPRLVLSRPAAERLGLTGQQVGWALRTGPATEAAHRERFVAALRPLRGVQVSYESGNPEGPVRPLLLLLAGAAGVITIGATAAATGLAAAEGRADLSTLAAVGAGPGVRRILSLSQAGVIAVVGSLLGIVAGLATALIILAALNRHHTDRWPVEPPFPTVVPWSTLGVLVVVPMVAMLGAGLLTRSRLPVERRLD